MGVSPGVKIVVCLLVLLHGTAVTANHTLCSNEGAVDIIGTVTPNLIAGRVEICVGGRMRAVYHVSWGPEEARIVCEGLGFPAEGTV